MQWEAMKRKLKPAFERAGITSCEVKLPDFCAGSYFLTWAHAVKRRFITTPEQLAEVCLSCAQCHIQIEAMSHAEMERIVREAIANREPQPKL